MMIAPVKIEQACKLVSRESASAQWQALSHARKRGLTAFAILAPLTALAGPLAAVPVLGMAGWLITGAGMLACVMLLFHVARLDADMSAYGPGHAAAARKRPAVVERQAPQQSVVQPFPTRGSRQQPVARIPKLKAFDGIRRRPYRLAH